jgi:signal transduction histidine kinase
VLRPVTLAIVLTSLAGMVAALGFARRGEQQVRDASALVRRILAGDLSQRLPSRPGTGFSVVSHEFNVALDRIEQLTVAMRAVADSTAHDLRGPLNRLRAALEVALVGEADPVRLRAAVERSLGELERVEMTLEALLRIALAEAGTASLAPVDLAAVVADIVELYRPLAEQKGQTLDARLEGGLVVNGNGQLLAQAVANLVDNAIKYTPRDGFVMVRAAHERDGISIVVSDTGPGVAVEDRARALERSRRLPSSAGTQGSGLGLALVAAVMRLHGATIELDDGSPGLVVRLWLRRG